MGAICALGDRPSQIHEALCEGRSGFAAPTVFPADIAPGYQVAEVPGFDAQNYLKTGNVRPLDRTGRLALVGVELTLADSGWTTERRVAQPVGLILGTMFCSVRTIGEFDRRAQQAGPEYASPMDFSNTVLNAAAGQVAIWQKLRGINTTVSAGASSGAQAIGYAMQMIRAGRADALLAGGAEEICYESFHGSRQAARLAAPNGGGGPRPFDASRSGTGMGEGAAFLALEAEETAAARGARVLARVAGFAAAYDPTCHADCLGSDPRQPPAVVWGQTRDNQRDRLGRRRRQSRRRAPGPGRRAPRPFPRLRARGRQRPHPFRSRFATHQTAADHHHRSARRAAPPDASRETTRSRSLRRLRPAARPRARRGSFASHSRSPELRSWHRPRPWC